jgi:hypothetical protein
MSSTYSFDLLRSKGAMLEVAMDKVEVLRPSDPRKAIGTRDLNGCTVIVVMGMPGPSVTVAKMLPPINLQLSCSALNAASAPLHGSMTGSARCIFIM